MPVCGAVRLGPALIRRPRTGRCCKRAPRGMLIVSASVRFLWLIALFGAQTISQPARSQPSSDSSDSLPTRRAGLWRISTLSAAAGLHFAATCLRPGDSIVGEKDPACGDPRVDREGDQVVVTISCEESGQHVVRSLLFTGDFTTWYRAQGKITSRGPTNGSEFHSGFTIDSSFVRSDCGELGRREAAHEGAPP
jgi:hypothetical protein